VKNIIKNKEKQIVAFYILYFGWLFTLTTLTVDARLQDYFAIAIVLFYFIFLRDIWDPFWFSIFAFAGIANRLHSLGSGFNYEILQDIPIWLPLSWGTTAVALRKFYIIVNQKIRT
jgi:hypothetical protein